MLGGLGIEVGELLVPVRVLAAFEGFAHGLGTYPVPQFGEFRGEL